SLSISAKPTLPEDRIVNSIGMKLQRIPAGKFVMGSPPSEARRTNDEDQHEVAITRPFAIGVTAVTVGQFGAFVHTTGHKTEAEKANDRFTWRQPGFEQPDDHPVVCVNWYDAVAFCDWLSQKEGKKYTLPTEAQWEYCGRAGSASTYYFGEDVN